MPYSLDRRAKVKFYLRPFFDLMDVAMTNSYIIWCKVNPDSKLTSLQFRRSVTRDLITVYGNRSVTYYTKQSMKRGVSSQLPILNFISQSLTRPQGNAAGSVLKRSWISKPFSSARVVMRRSALPKSATASEIITNNF